MTNSHSEAARVLGERVRTVRTQLGLSLEDVGSLAETHWTSIGKIERGQVHPSVATLVRIANALDTDPGFFVEGLTTAMYPEPTHGLSAADLIKERAARRDAAETSPE